MKKIVLASASPRRSELLRQIGLEFEVCPSNAEERMDNAENPDELVQKLALDKALEVARASEGNRLVIGADTIVVREGVILGKPKDAQEAREMLKMLQGNWHHVLTGLAVIEVPGYKVVKGLEKTLVKMRELSDEEIDAYVNTHEPMDKAGAYGIQGIGALLVEKIEGCYFNVVGLPLVRLSSILKEFGTKVLA